MGQNVIRILVEHDEKTGNWVAQCVDFDLVAEAKTWDDIPKAFGHVLYGNIVLALEHGESPRMDAAPESVKSKWHDSITAETKVRIIPHERFVPDWLPEAVEKLQRKFDQPSELVLAKAVKQAA